jgi:deazaflavin-dependent oxidoreductase (nitroreductase family)
MKAGPGAARDDLLADTPTQYPHAARQGLMTDQDTIAAALRQGGVIDMTTIGRRSGQPRRIEIVFFSFEGRLYISGLPGRRGWLANLAADPRLTLHLKRGVRADIPGTARIIIDEVERRPLLDRITAIWGRSDRLELFVARAPLIEVVLDTPLVATGGSPQGGYAA